MVAHTMCVSVYAKRLGMVNGRFHLPRQSALGRLLSRVRAWANGFEWSPLGRDFDIAIGYSMRFHAVAVDEMLNGTPRCFVLFTLVFKQFEGRTELLVKLSRCIPSDR